MGSTRVITSLISLLFIAAVPMHQNHDQSEIIPCPQNVQLQMRSAIDQMVWHKYPQAQSEDIEIRSLQGFLCEIKNHTKTFMAEMVYVRISLGENGWAHGVFHVHFTETGEWIITGGSNPNKFKESLS